MKELRLKIKEAAYSVIPITLIVLILYFTPLLRLSLFELSVFVVASIVLIFSMGIFNLGADMAMSPMGEYAGAGLTKTGRLSILLIVSFMLGLLVTIAEPDLIVLGGQVEGVIDGGVLIFSVGIGVGVFLSIAILKIVAHKPLSNILMLFYMFAFALVALLYENNKINLLPLSFDSGGVTTGPITVPFIMSFGLGIAASIGGKDVNENSFGLVSLCSIGPIIVVLILSILSEGNFDYVPTTYSMKDVFQEGIFKEVIKKAVEVLKALGILFVSFMIIELIFLKLPLNKLKQIILGIIITYVGLVIFLSTVTIGFFPIGYTIGIQMAEAPRYILLIFAFIIGMTVVLAEPAVHVLNKQVEDVTAGTVTKRSMMIALSIGVGISLTLSVIRQVYGFSILYYIIPGYFISLMLSLFVPPLYTSIAFDSGGVASGPMTSTFILPMMIGCCMTLRSAHDVMYLAFGVVALVAMTPLITIQLLGFKAVMSSYIRNRIVMNKIRRADDDQIVYFNY